MTQKNGEASIPLGRRRWGICALLFVLTAINFADRGVLGVVGPVLMKSFHLSVAQFGIVASAFGWGYAPVVFVSGWIVSALGARRTYNWFVTLWSVLIAATAMAGSFGTLFILRLFFGASEGTVFPAAGQLIGKWLPFSERGRAAGLMLAGIPLGALLVVPLSVWLTRAYGWQVPFVVLGVLGIVWVLVANAIMVDSPHGDGAIAESVPVHSDRDEVLAGTEKRPPWGRIFRSRTLWLAGLASFSSAYGLYFMLSFFPTYLVRQRHVAFAAVALLGTVPWAAMVAGALVSGVVSDYIYRQFGAARAARTFLAGGALVINGILIAVSVSVSSTAFIVSLLSLASFINFVGNPICVAISIDAVPDFGGPALGLSTGLGSLSGVFAPLLTGLLVQTSGTFASAFVVVAGLPILFGLLLIFACRPGQL